MTEKDDVQTSALHIKKGVARSGEQKSNRKKFVKKATVVPVEEIFSEMEQGSRNALAKGITLLESIKREDQKYAQELLQKALPQTGNSVRIGISGVPGAGKSTFIETFGYMLCELGHKVAVLAIDPSSSISGGSILGDKTRMEKLASHPNAFIRPSPSSGTLGGVHRKTRETMLLCEAAGFDVILIETVGVGQSETAVRNMVDFFTLIALTGAGDDLQGMKKGIMEITDLIIVHKADGENVRPAKRTVREYKQILHSLQPATPGWQTQSVAVSSYLKTGHMEVWEIIQDFQKQMQESGYWEERRSEQQAHWFQDMIHDRLVETFFGEAGRKEKLQELEGKINNGELTIALAVDELFE